MRKEILAKDKEIEGLKKQISNIKGKTDIRKKLPKSDCT